MYYVYGLTTIEHDRFIYIGASNNPQRRINDHIASRGQRDSPLKRRLYDKHDDIGYVVLFECSDWRTALNKEREFIELYLDAGHPLLNRTHTPSFKQEMIEMQRKKTEHFNSPEQVERRAGMERVLGVWGKCALYKISYVELFNLFPFFEEANRKKYIEKDQYDMICRELPILLQLP